MNMASCIIGLILLSAMASYSEGNYCVCNGGMSDHVLQTNIDYACGAGADCSAIQQNGACFNPNTVRDHCNYAVNSYYQRKGQVTGSCDFQGSATLTPNPPTTTASGCVYPSGPSNLSSGNTTPANNPTITGGIPSPIGPTNQSGNMPGSSLPQGPVLGLGPSSFSNPDSSDGGYFQLSHNWRLMIFSLSVLVVISKELSI